MKKKSHSRIQLGTNTDFVQCEIFVKRWVDMRKSFGFAYLLSDKQTIGINFKDGSILSGTLYGNEVQYTTPTESKETYDLSDTITDNAQ